MKDIKSFVLILIFHCFQRLHFLVEISKGGRNYARGCVKILIFLMSSNIASTDLHVAKSTYTHNLKVESWIILLHFRYQTKSSRMQQTAVKCILSSYPQKIGTLHQNDSSDFLCQSQTPNTGTFERRGHTHFKKVCNFFLR